MVEELDSVSEIKRRLLHSRAFHGYIAYENTDGEITVTTRERAAERFNAGMEPFPGLANNEIRTDLEKRLRQPEAETVVDEE